MARPDVEPSDAGGVTSVDNALWLLQLVAERQAIRVAEAADLLGVARSTAHRLLSALRRRGFVMQNRPNGAYRPGPALHEIGLVAINRIDIRRIARPVLEQVQEQSQETTSLAVLEGTSVRFIDCVESGRSVRVGNRTGIVRQAHASAVGKAILAALPTAEVERRYPDKTLPAGTATSLTDRDALLEQLAEVRAQGYALNFEESADGVSAVGVALYDASGNPIAALGIAAPSSRTGNIEGIRAHAPAVLRGAQLVQERMRTPD
ncbi:IclR family transcriptional regulator [Pseudonocardia zijingensis]|uniref:IclR family transcriptional regulator n=1 Tax=Pseudonocardia zijingensis TaxID=153376 RepID=A0ABP3YMA6_9PSEU